MKEKAIEKLKLEFDKSSYMGKVIINNCLLPEIQNNESFSEKILNEKKNVKDMLSTVTSWIRTSKNNAPSHNIIFSAAIHYYQEVKPEYVKEIMEERPMEFGNIENEFNTPIITHITGTIIREVIKEVAKKTPKKDIPKKVKKTVKENMKKVTNQLSLFDENN